MSLEFLSKPWVAVPLFIWVGIWKGMALWKASQKKQLSWFIILFLVNTLGLLEIAYLYYLNRWDLDQGKLLKFLQKKSKS
jgi:methionyl-tRNA synthetase